MEDNHATKSKYEAALAKYNTIVNDEEVAKKVAEIKEKEVPENDTKEIKKLLFNCIDLTTLRSEDNDKSVMRMCYTHRRVFSQLIVALMQEGQKAKALAALNYCEKVIPEYNIPYDFQNGAVQMAEAYYQLGKRANADHIMLALASKSVEYLNWYLSMGIQQIAVSSQEIEYNLALLDQEVKLMNKYNSNLSKQYTMQLNTIYNKYSHFMKSAQ